MIDIYISEEKKDVIYLKCSGKISLDDVKHVFELVSYHNLHSEMEIVVGLSEDAELLDKSILIYAAKYVNAYYMWLKELVVFGMNRHQNHLFSMFLMLGPNKKINYRVMPNLRKTEELLHIDTSTQFRPVYESDVIFH